MGSGLSTGVGGGLPPGFLPVTAVFAARASSFASYSASSLAKRSFARASNFARGHREFRQPVLTPRQFLRDRHAIGDIGLIGRFGFCQQVGHFGLQLRLDLSGVLVRQRAVPAGVGVDFGAIQGDGAHPEHAHLACQEQHFDEQSLDLGKKSPSERGDGVVIATVVCRDKAERYGIMGRSFELAAGEYLGRVGVEQKAQQRCRIAGGRAGAAITLAHGGQAKTVHNLHHEPGNVPLRQPLVDRWGQKEAGRAIGRAEIGQGKVSGDGR